MTRVLDGATLPAALAAVDDGAATRGRALVQELAYGTLRHWGRLSALDARRSRPSRCPIALLAALVAVALYQLDHTQAPAFAVVDRAVDAAALLVAAAGQAAGQRAAAPLPARTRRAATRRSSRRARSRAGRIRAGGSDACEADHPAHWQAILDVGNERPPLTLRVNRRVDDARRAGGARSAAAGIAADAGRRGRPHRRRRRGR